MNRIRKVFVIAVITAAAAICAMFGSFTAGAAEVSGTSGLTMKYYNSNSGGGSWTTFSKSVTASGIKGIRLTTPSNAGYYLEYQTWNSGKTGFYSAVKSNSTASNAYAGTGDEESTQRAVQCLRVNVKNLNGTAMNTEVVVIYRVKANGKWLSWVSSGDYNYSSSLMKKYGLSGNLEPAGGDDYAGIPGSNIEGVEIRLFDERGSSDQWGDVVNSLSGKEESPSLYYTTGGASSFISFSKATPILSGTVNTLKINTSTSKKYYISYKVKAQGQSGYYSAINSTHYGSEDYAGSFSKPIQRLQIEVYTNYGTKVTDNIVVMYRAYTAEDKWLPWVSNADPDWMESVKLKYNIAGDLDKTDDGYAGIDGHNIKAVEIRLFEEKSLMTDCGHQNETVIDVPYISQLPEYPTGCESVSTVMALNYAGADISVDTFIDDYLDKKNDTYNFDPNVCFGGDPRSSSGIGCYAPVIKKALDKILAGSSLYGENVTGASLSELCSEYIDNGIPVITWATTDMEEAYPGKQLATMQWIAPEHCLLLVGYDDRCYIFNDPQRSAEYHYIRADVEAAYQALGRQAVVILEKELPCPDTPSSALPNEYAKENTAPEAFSGNIDLGRGAFTEELSVITAGNGFSLYYDSSRRVSGSFGAGWYHSFEKRLEKDGENIKVYENPSVYCVYGKVSDGVYAAAGHGRENYILTELESGYVLDCNKNGKLYFDAAGRLTASESKNRETTALSYGQNSVTVTYPDGGSVTLNFTGSLVTKVTGAGQTVSLTYTNGYLISASGAGISADFTYADNGALELFESGSETLMAAYDGDGRLILLNDGGKETKLSYTNENGGVSVSVTAGGKTERAVFGGNGLLAEYEDVSGKTSYEYDENLNLTLTAYPDGKRDIVLYGAANMPVRYEYAAGSTKTLAYDGENNVISIVYNDKGDTNGDGQIDIRDFVRMKRILAGDALPEYSAAPDINGDGTENAADSVILEQYIFGKDVEFIYCETFTYDANNNLLP